MCPECTAKALKMILVIPTFDDQLSKQKSYKFTDLLCTLHDSLIIPPRYLARNNDVPCEVYTVNNPIYINIIPIMNSNLNSFIINMILDKRQQYL